MHGEPLSRRYCLLTTVHCRGALSRCIGAVHCHLELPTPSVIKYSDVKMSDILPPLHAVPGSAARQADCQADRQAGCQVHRQADRQADRQAHCEANPQAHTETHAQAHTQTDAKADPAANPTADAKADAETDCAAGADRDHAHTQAHQVRLRNVLWYSCTCLRVVPGFSVVAAALASRLICKPSARLSR